MGRPSGWLLHLTRSKMLPRTRATHLYLNRVTFYSISQQLSTCLNLLIYKSTITITLHLDRPFRHPSDFRFRLRRRRCRPLSSVHLGVPFVVVVVITGRRMTTILLQGPRQSNLCHHTGPIRYRTGAHRWWQVCRNYGQLHGLKLQSSLKV